MRTLLISILFLLSVNPSQASEIIRIQTPYTANHSGTPAMFRIIETANKIQKKYTFVLEFRPGGNQVIAVKHMDQDPQRNLAIIAASFVENVELGHLRYDDYVPVWSLGDACWTVMSTNWQIPTVQGLKDTKEITVGTVAFGNATHLTALQIGRKHNLAVRMVPFKSNYDAVINMVGNNGVTFVLDTPETFENFKDKNPRLRMLAVSCARRLPDYPDVRTLREQGIVVPSVINIVVANTAMLVDKRTHLAQILEQAAEQIGEIEIRRASGFVPPQFDRISAQEHFAKSTELIARLRKEFQKEIKQSQ
jgi:tripartite-type tricarboxylate transporter receptor subunit TctC